MYDFGNVVGRYPECLPWCTGARVEDRSDTERVASVKVARGILRTEFTTRNTLRRDAQILMHLIDGPFRDLIGEWRFAAPRAPPAARRFCPAFRVTNTPPPPPPRPPPPNG